MKRSPKTKKNSKKGDKNNMTSRRVKDKNFSAENMDDTDSVLTDDVGRVYGTVGRNSQPEVQDPQVSLMVRSREGENI